MNAQNQTSDRASLITLSAVIAASNVIFALMVNHYTDVIERVI